MSGLINPEAGQPTTTQSFEQSNRNPVVNWPGTDADGGPISAPAAAASRMTKAGAGPSADAGLANYGDRESGDGVEDSAEAQG